MNKKPAPGDRVTIVLDGYLIEGGSDDGTVYIAGSRRRAEAETGDGIPAEYIVSMVRSFSQ